MTDIITRSFHVNITVLKFVGLYDRNRRGIVYKIGTYFLYFLTIVLTILIVVKLFVGENDDFDQWSRSLMYLNTSTSCHLKFIPLMVNGPRIKKCINFFGNKRFAPKNNQEKKIIEDCVYICKRNFFIYVSLVILLEFSWSIMPLLDEKQKLPADIWLPAGAKPVLLCAAYLYCSAVIFYNGITTTMIELILAGLPYHATGQFKILKSNLQNLVPDLPQNGTDSIIRFEDADKVLRKCIFLHNNILYFIAEFEDCFSWTLFFQIVTTTLGLCFCCLGYVSNNELRDAIYLGPWYRYDVKIRKTLLIIMERSKVPITLTAGKVVNLDYGIFTWALKTSYSLIAVLKSF
ncbi:hypothetical protein Zmor_021226 [Zophobas morio]|uniref:Odorant receptor n=1 Tax=Zophobas morio TaxID=2755281 RepID=A0AA38I5U8_9CUCU|nr:hypothetical protein Zmor_021226 [Zophobas morio]